MLRGRQLVSQEESGGWGRRDAAEEKRQVLLRDVGA